MAKLTATLAAAVLLLLAAAYSEASVRTTVIIDEDTDNQGWGGREPGSCWSQLQKQGNLRRCQDYMMQEAQRGGSGWRGRGRRDEMAENPQQGGDPFTACCSGLRQMDPQCTCMGLESALGQMMKDRRGQLREQSLQSAWQIAQSLPGQCGVTSPSRCQFQGQPGGRYYDF